MVQISFDKFAERAPLHAVLLAGLAFATSASADQAVSIASWGGAYQEAQEKALYEPASEVTGIVYKHESFGGMSDVRLKAQAGVMPWDLVVSGAASAAQAAAEGLLQPLNYQVIDASDIFPGMYTSTCVGTDVFSYVFAYNVETYADNAPKTWADFFDVENFPGKRAYRGKVTGALEPALLADGVPADEIYKVLGSEEGIQRALNKIRRLKPHISVWWQSGAQHAQLMKDDEVDMSTGWNGRFDNAKSDGAKLDYGFDGGLMDFSCWAIPEGAENPELATKFLAEMTKAEFQANLPKYISYGPANKRSFDVGKIEADLAKKLPTSPENFEKQILIDLDWYAKWESQAAVWYQEMITE